MKTLTIRGVPEDVYRALKQRARRNRRNVNEEVIVELAAVSDPEVLADASELGRRRKRAEAMTELVEKWRSRLPGMMSKEEIDTAIAEGWK